MRPSALVKVAAAPSWAITEPMSFARHRALFIFPLATVALFVACGGDDTSNAGGGPGLGDGGAGNETSAAGDGGSPGTDADVPLPTGKLAIGYWCGAPASFLTQARFDEMAAAGFTIASNPCDPSSNNATYNQQMLTMSAKAGMTAIVSDARMLAAAAGQNVETNLDAVVADYAKSNGLYAYFAGDEPSEPSFPNIAAAFAGLKKRDPAHPGFANLLPVYASAGQFGAATYDQYLADFLAQVKPELFSYDHYNFNSDGTDGAQFFQNLVAARAHGLATHTPYWQYIQSISYTAHRATNGPEKRWAALHTLAYGGAGVMYFTYWTPPQTAESFGDGIIDAQGNETSQYADVKDINREIAAMGRYLVAATSTGMFHNGPLDAGTVPRTPGAPVYVPSTALVSVGLFSVPQGTYALLVNRDHTKATTTDVVVASAHPQTLDVATATFVPATATPGANGTSTLHLTMPAGDGVLVYLPGPAAQGPLGAEAFVGTVRADAGALDVVDSAFGAQTLRLAGWNDCPTGYTLAGRDFQSNGFWLCARNDLTARTFYVGNVVSDAGALFSVKGGTATSVGAAGWDTCPAGKLVGHRFESNGFWVCLE